MQSDFEHGDENGWILAPPQMHLHTEQYGFKLQFENVYCVKRMSLVDHVGTSAIETRLSTAAGDAKYAMVHRRAGGNRWDIVVEETDINLPVPLNIKPK